MIQLLLVFHLCGCATRSAAPDSINTGVRELRERTANHGSATFRTWNGKRVGGDADAELTLFRDGSAHLFEWGLSGESLNGTYHVHPDGCVVVWIENFRTEWPVMVVYRDSDALRLRPLDPPIGYREETRATITDPNRASYWNFRLLTGDDERQVLELIKRREAERRSK
jgi:hypothetical protein